MATRIGRYTVRLDETMLVLTHPAGISFDLSLKEAQDLLEFLTLHHQIMSDTLAETDPLLKRVLVDQELKHPENA